MSLCHEARNYFIRNVFESFNDSPQYRILVLDEFATTVLTACFKMHELMELNITLLENIVKKRKPLPLEAIYLMEPSDTNIGLLMNDFTHDRVCYNCAHLFFLHTCEDRLIKEMATSSVGAYIKTLVDLELSFMPLESHVFSLEDRPLRTRYSILSKSGKPNQIEESDLNVLADRLTTLCCSLNEFPKIIYQNEALMNQKLGLILRDKLIEAKKHLPSLGCASPQNTTTSHYKDQSTVLILDRSIDLVSPLLHELTLQAMVYDVLDIENDMYQASHDNSLDLLDRNAIWTEYRHWHIADLEMPLKKRFEAFLQKIRKRNTEMAAISNEESDPDKQLRVYRNKINSERESMQEEATLVAIKKLNEHCSQIFHSQLIHNCQVEQDLVMGRNGQNEVINSEKYYGILAKFLMGNTSSKEDKMRAILLFLMVRDSNEAVTTEEDLHKFLECAKLDHSYKDLVYGLCRWFGGQLITPNVDILNSTMDLKYFPEAQEITNRAPFRRWCFPSKDKRVNRWEPDYVASRWLPYINDLLEQVVSGKLDKKAFTQVPGSGNTSMNKTVQNVDSHALGATSARFKPSSYGSEDKNSSMINPTKLDSSADSAVAHVGPRLIVVMLGGFTWSEARSAYKFTKHCIETRLAASDSTHNAMGANSDSMARKNLTKNSSLNGLLQNEDGGNIASSKTIPNGGGIGWNWEVYLGGTHLLTPKSFLQDLKQLARDDNPFSDGWKNKTGKSSNNDYLNSTTAPIFTNQAMEI